MSGRRRSYCTDDIINRYGLVQFIGESWKYFHLTFKRHEVVSMNYAWILMETWHADTRKKRGHSTERMFHGPMPCGYAYPLFHSYLFWIFFSFQLSAESYDLFSVRQEFCCCYVTTIEKIWMPPQKKSCFQSQSCTLITIKSFLSLPKVLLTFLWLSTHVQFTFI